LRKVGAFALGVPVVGRVYAATLLTRSAGRIFTGVALFSLVGLVVVASLPPTSSTAVQVSGKPGPVAAELLDSVRTGHALRDPFTIRFDAAMDGPSVAAALRIEPQDAVSLAWDAAGRTLTVTPVGRWQADTLYAITVDASAHTTSGIRLSAPVRAVILTRPPGSADLAASTTTGTRVRLDTSFTIHVDRPATVAAVQAALRTDPALDGTVTEGDVPGTFVFSPSAALAPDTRYRVWLDGLQDAEGVAFAAVPALTVRSIVAPTVVRFRPHAKTHDVSRTAVLSVRFSQAMDRKATAAALRVLVGRTQVAGKVTWAGGGTVLVFRPTASFRWGNAVTISVGAAAQSADGAPLANPTYATFGVERKPAPAKRAASRGSVNIGHSGGSGAVGGSWLAVERYYLRLMNCTRTGGWVTSTGACSSPGGRNVAPLALSAGISSHVSRPYAKLLATRGLCSHFVGGNPGDRLRRAGYTSYRWAENLGCRSGNPYSAVLGSHLFFQSEKSYGGGHYVNLMNAAYDWVGIGVWVSGGRVRLVVDFYHP
jgi:hypothetical protein